VIGMTKLAIALILVLLALGAPAFTWHVGYEQGSVACLHPFPDRE